MADARSAVTLDLQGLQGLLDVLTHTGFTVLGPTVRNGAVVPGRLSSVDDLPRGWGDVQEPGNYRLRRRDDEALFGYRRRRDQLEGRALPARELIWAGSTDAGRVHVDAERRPSGRDSATRRTPSSASARATCTRSRSTTGCCASGAYPDAHYAARRKDAFLITVVCSDPSGTCFCVSMGTGPRPESGLRPRADRAAGRRATGSSLDAGSDRGAGVLDRAVDARRRAERATWTRPRQVVDHADRAHGPRDGHHRHPRPALRQRRAPPVGRRGQPVPVLRQLHDGVPDLLLHLRRGHTDLTGDEAERWRVWDSCFTTDFSYLHGGSVRESSARSRYRQWMTHKLGILDRPVRHVRLRGLRPLPHLVPGRHRHHRGGGAPSAPTRARRRTERGLTMTVAGRAAGCAPVLRRARRLRPWRCSSGARSNVHFRPATYLFHEGEPADRFFVVRRGRVALDVHVPGPAAPAWSTPSTTATSSAGPGWSRRTGGSSTPARSTGVSAVAFDARLPARQVRRGPGSRLRADAARRTGDVRAAAVGAGAAARPVRGRPCQLTAGMTPAAPAAADAWCRARSASRTPARDTTTR